MAPRLLLPIKFLSYLSHSLWVVLARGWGAKEIWKGARSHYSKWVLICSHPRPLHSFLRLFRLWPGLQNQFPIFREPGKFTGFSAAVAGKAPVLGARRYLEWLLSLLVPSVPWLGPQQPLHCPTVLSCLVRENHHQRGTAAGKQGRECFCVVLSAFNLPLPTSSWNMTGTTL